MKPHAGTPQATVVVGDDGTSEVFNPAVEAHRLRLQGMGWADIAGICGYRTTQNCQTAVQRMLLQAGKELDARRRAQLLMLEVQRLDAIQHAYWDAAIGGNIFAAQLILKIVEQRVKLLRLAEPEVANAVPQAALVIAGDQEQYVAGLRKVVEISRATLPGTG